MTSDFLYCRSNSIGATGKYCWTFEIRGKLQFQGSSRQFSGIFVRRHHERAQVVIISFVCQNFHLILQFLNIRDAAMVKMREVTANRTPSQIKKLRVSLFDVPITLQHINLAIENCKPSVSQSSLKGYEDWIATFGSS